MGDLFAINNAGGVLHGCIDLCYSPDDGGWYAHECDFKRKASRTSKKIYRTRELLVAALKSGQHKWEAWS